MATEKESTRQTIKRLEKYIYNLKAARELNTLGTAERDAMVALRTDVTAARIAYEYSQAEDDARATIRAVEETIERLEAVREELLAASQYDLLTTVDVAQLSALTEHILEAVRKIISE